MQPVLTASIYALTSTKKQSCFSAHPGSTVQRCQGCWLFRFLAALHLKEMFNRQLAPTAPECYDLELFRNCSVDVATSGVAKTVLLGSCSQFFAMKFLVMTLQPLHAEPVRYRFSKFIQAINLRGADKPSLWALGQLKKSTRTT